MNASAQRPEDDVSNPANSATSFHPPGSGALSGPADDQQRPHGLWRANYPDGSRAAEVTFEHGEPVATATQWTTHGSRIVETEVFDGYEEIRAFDTDDRLVQTRQNIGPLPHGTTRQFYPNGQVVLESEYDFGLAHGRGRQYAMDGTVVDQGEFVYGIPRNDGFVPLSVLGGGGGKTLAALVAVGVLVFLVVQNPRSVLGIVALGLGIVIHELGHFLVGKRLGLPIEAFRVGVGPNLLTFLWRGTRYELAAIPLAGWVKVPAMFEHQWEGWRRYRDGETVPGVRSVTSETLRELRPPRPASNYLSVGRRIAFFGGGVVANLFTVFVLLWLAATPTRPDVAAMRTAEMTARTVMIVPRALAEQFRPETYTSDRPGLLRAVRDDREGGLIVKPLMVISLLLGVFNLLPVPPLDGFRIVEAAAEGVTGRRLPDGLTRAVYLVGGLAFAVLILSGVYLIGRDVLQMLLGR